MADKASLVIRNRRIYTVDRPRSWTHAIAANGERIVFGGSNEGVKKYIDSNTTVRAREKVSSHANDSCQSSL